MLPASPNEIRSSQKTVQPWIEESDQGLRRASEAWRVQKLVCVKSSLFKSSWCKTCFVQAIVCVKASSRKINLSVWFFYSHLVGATLITVWQRIRRFARRAEQAKARRSMGQVQKLQHAWPHKLGDRRPISKEYNIGTVQNKLNPHRRYARIKTLPVPVMTGESTLVKMWCPPVSHWGGTLFNITYITELRH